MIHLSDAAQTHFLRFLEDDEVLGIRFEVKGMGCSGMTVDCSLVKSETVDDEDVIFNSKREVGENVFIYVDHQSLVHLDNMAVDCVLKGLSHVVTYDIPNATSKCGCGNSFQIGP